MKFMLKILTKSLYIEETDATLITCVYYMRKLHKIVGKTAGLLYWNRTRIQMCLQRDLSLPVSNNYY